MVFEKERLLLAVSEGILKAMEKEIGELEYKRIMSEPIKGCSCGFIKDGDYTYCPKCEDQNDSTERVD